MAHYALLDENNIVTNVIKGRDEDEVVQGISDWEAHYGEFHNQVCKRTSYNSIGNVHREGGVPFRKNYAQIGGRYSEELDAFIPPKPFESWRLNEETFVWEPPVAHPNDNNLYYWDEPSLAWIEVTA